jgi:hypothetical protein
VKCNFYISTLIETRGNQNFVQINKKTWNGLTSSQGERGTKESQPEVNGISSKLNSMTVHEFGDSTSFASLGYGAPIT